MPLIEIILWVAGVVVSLFGGLLLIIGYFLKELHRDFKELKAAVVQLIGQAVRNEEKGRSGFKLLDQRLNDHDKRIERLEEQMDQLP